MPDDPAKPPRFPIVAALLCAGCLGAAAWTWMLYSYAWDLEPFLTVQYNGGPRDWPHGAYAKLTGVVKATSADEYDSYATVVASRGGIAVAFLPSDSLDSLNTYREREQVSLKGRVISMNPGTQGAVWHLDVRESRFTGANIAGLVVGAMGVFVFTVALRHWLGQRRRFREDMKGHNQSVDRSPSAR